MTHKIAASCLGLLLAGSCSIAGSAVAAESAEAFPSKRIVIVVAQGAGGSTDVDTRNYSERLSRIFNQAVVVENKPGAGGLIGNTFVAKAPGDGYTLLSTSTSITITPSIRKNPPFDLRKDFAPISMLTRSPTMLVVGNHVPVSNLNEYIAWARNQAGGPKYAAAGGVGAYIHLSGEWLHDMIKSKVTIVHYPGAPAAMVDLTSGRLDATISSVNFLIPFVQGKKVKPVAAASADRLKLYPDLPTLAEGGLTGYDSNFWVGFLAPAATPPAIVNKLGAAFGQIARQPDLVKKLEDAGQVPVGSTPEEFRRAIEADIARWGNVVRSARVVVEE